MTEKIRLLLLIWLSVCCLLVFAMVLLGGAVRLTGSGLSMVDWQPILGVIPPIGEEAWRLAFEKYQQFPEFKLLNSDMTVQEFKLIFSMEYAHRILGRLIGIVFFIPFLIFFITDRIGLGLKIRLVILLFLGAMQGGIGWYMVKSGLIDQPAVSQYRLALHLVVAVIIYAGMIRLISGLLLKRNAHQADNQRDVLGWITIATVLLMICSGAFVAGTHAGFIYNTYPTMGGAWLPDQLFSMTPLWKNLFENPVTIQFFHRVMALVSVFVVICYVGRLCSTKHRRQRPIILPLMILSALFIQVSLGIATLLLSVPVFLGVAHQAGALLLFGILVFTVTVRMPALLDHGAH